MGLDMYLSKKTYIWRDDRKGLQIKGIEGVRASKVKEIVEEAGYWRKANQIHKWFVDNVQDGEDNCAEYYVDQEQLKELLDTVETVLKASKLVAGEICNGYTYENGKRIPDMVKGKVIKDSSVAEELLPVQEGFFFGGTGYDEYYISDLKETKKILKEALKDKKASYYYQSNW